MTWMRENDMQISQFFVNGDIKGAIAYMRDHEEFKDILPAYVAIFEDQKYRHTERTIRKEIEEKHGGQQNE